MTTRPQVRFLDRKTPPHIVTLVLMTGLSALSMNIFLPSLPNMTAYFATEYSVMQLSVSLYLGANAVLQIFIGPISDRFGRRPVLLWSLGLFVLATIGTLFASTIEMFLLFRIGQAVVASTMVLSRAVVRDMVPQNEAASMIGYVTMGTAIVPMIGPMIGGVLDEVFGWQSTFILMLACGIGVFVLTLTDLGETGEQRQMSLGAQVREYPELLKSQRFWGYCLASAFASGSFFAFLGGAPFVGTEVFHLPPATLGLYFGAPAVGYALGNFISGRYSRRFGVNRMVFAGALVNLVGLSLLTLIYLTVSVQPPVFFGFFSAIGLGNGLALPNATAGMLSVRPKLAGTASGLGGAMMIGGGAALSALTGALLVPGSGAMPLLIVMVLSAVAAVLSILWVIWREQALERGL